MSGGQQHRVCWSCVSGLEVVLISSGVDVFLSAEKLNSSSEDQETEYTPITRPLNELLPVHPPTHHLVHHIGLGLTDTHNLAHTHNLRRAWEERAGGTADCSYTHRPLSTPPSYEAGPTPTHSTLVHVQVTECSTATDTHAASAQDVPSTQPLTILWVYCQ